VLISSGVRWALLHELRGDPQMTLPAALARLSACDLALVEGYKTAAIPKLEIWREGLQKPLLHVQDPHVVAIATDVPAQFAHGAIPAFPLAALDEIATFVDEHSVVWPAPD
jgi:molybdopterin-guanine dinucleotide biosynthesis protein B